MQNPDRFTQGWQAVFGKRIAARLAGQWLLPAALLILALGIGYTPSIRMVQAQDEGTGSGTRISARFVLQVNTPNPRLNNLCVGESVRLPITVRLQTVEFTGSGDIGDITIRGATLTPTVAPSSVVTVAPGTGSPGTSPNAPFVTSITITGQAEGSATITLNATVQSDVILSLDEEVALPIPIASQADPVSVPVRVNRCRFTVMTNSWWQTTIGSSSVVLSATSQVFLEADVNGVFQSPDETAVNWFSAWNRPSGCLATNSRHQEETGITVRGAITGDVLRLTLTFQPLTSARILPNRCPGGFTETGIVPYLDNDPGGTPEAQATRDDPTFTLESPTLEVPINSARIGIPISSVFPQWLNRRDGIVDGRLTITVTRVPSGANP